MTPLGCHIALAGLLPPSIPELQAATPALVNTYIFLACNYTLPKLHGRLWIIVKELLLFPTNVAPSNVETAVEACQGGRGERDGEEGED